jgi:hypothetical protein
MKATTHNGKITMHNPATDGYKIMRIKTQRKDASFAPNERILSLKVGHNFMSLGIIKDSSVILWKKHRSDNNIAKIVNLVMNQDKYSDKLEYLWEGTCRCCNRPLTTPKSIHFGIGPVCFERYEAQKSRELAEAWKNWQEIATDDDQRALEADALEIPMNML